jgi:Holliday junction DNA helicase RuvB
MSSAPHPPASAIDPLRPTLLNDFNGQPAVRAHLEIILGGARARGQLCDHLLFAGPPGLGKTTLAGIVAHELAVPMVTTSGPALERPGDLVGLLSSLSGPSVVFVDEIHGLRRPLAELLYPALEDGKIDVSYGEGTNTRSIALPLQPFVLVGATTIAGMLPAPLRDRFGYVASRGKRSAPPSP